MSTDTTVQDANSNPPAPQTDHDSDKDSHRPLSQDLQAVLAHADGKPISLRELTDVLAERGLAMVLAVSTFPFLLPVPTMGLSAPAGAAVAIYGVCLILGLKPWLPDFLARRQISHPVLEKVVGHATHWSRRAEKFLKPRLSFMLWPGVNILIGASLIFSGFFMALPLPIPFTNSIPALAILLLLAGIMERDGVFVLAGVFISATLAAVTAVFVYLVFVYGWQGVKHMLGIGGQEPAPAADPVAMPMTGPVE